MGQARRGFILMIACFMVLTLVSKKPSTKLAPVVTQVTKDETLQRTTTLQQQQQEEEVAFIKDRKTRVMNEEEEANVQQQKQVQQQKPLEICNYQGSKHERPLKEWHERASHVMIIGAQKAGTTDLERLLCTHPQVIRPRGVEQHYFDKHMKRFLYTDNSTSTTITHIRMRDARLGYTRRWFDSVSLKARPDAVSLDKTPSYLFYSDRVASRAVCISPWSKILVVLRDPVSRAYSQYHHARKHDLITYNTTFQQKVDADVLLLKQCGVLDDPFDDEAWTRYLDTVDAPHALVGRGLYAIQLRQWFRAWNNGPITLQENEMSLPMSNNKLPKKPHNFRILNADNVHNQPQKLFRSIFAFLKLKKHAIPREYLTMPQSNKGYYYRNEHLGELGEKLSERLQRDEDTKAMLASFFAPFNDQLADLIGEEWRGLWLKK